MQSSLRSYSLPSIDDQNPFYCPTVSAASYVNSLRQLDLRTQQGSRIARKSQSRSEKRLLSFANILRQALLVDEPGLFDFLPRQRNCSHSFQSSSSHSSDTESSVLASVRASGCPTILSRHLPALKSSSKRKRISQTRDSFSSLTGPPSYGISFQQETKDGSEEYYEAKRLRFDDNSTHHSLSIPDSRRRIDSDKPDYAPISSSLVIEKLTSKIRALESDLYGIPIGTESPRGIQPLIAQLDSLLPGIRLRERLSCLDHPTHQSIADVLSSNGYLNSRIMNIFRTSEINSMTLTASLIDENGLNISGKDILPMFCKPNSFLFLSELVLSGAPIQDSDIIYIHHLPKLSILYLNNTGIGNEAVFLLTSLKRTLTQLSLAMNPVIDDDAVPPLLLLSKLSFLSIIDTSIDMPGLRRLAGTIYNEDRLIDIEIPSACAAYIDNLHSKYLVRPVPPYLSDPAVCPELSISALRRNLAAHALCNPDIVAAGTKAEMVERLQIILKTRDMDLLVRQMIWGEDASHNGE